MVLNESYLAIYLHCLKMLAKLVKGIRPFMFFAPKSLQKNMFIVFLELGRLGQSVLKGALVVSSTDIVRRILSKMQIFVCNQKIQRPGFATLIFAQHQLRIASLLAA